MAGEEGGPNYELVDITSNDITGRYRYLCCLVRNLRSRFRSPVLAPLPCTSCCHFVLHSPVPSSVSATPRQPCTLSCELALCIFQGNSDELLHLLTNSILLPQSPPLPTLVERINSVRLSTGLPLLHYAVLCGQSLIVKELLRLGAEAGVEFACAIDHGQSDWEADFLGHCMERLTPLWLAAALQEADIVDMLVSNGAALVTPFFRYHRTVASPWAAALSNVEILKRLHCGGKHRVPILYAAIAMFLQETETVKFLLQKGVCVWSGDVLAGCALSVVIRECESGIRLLDVCPESLEEQLVKNIFMYNLLLNISTKTTHYAQRVRYDLCILHKLKDNLGISMYGLGKDRHMFLIGAAYNLFNARPNLVENCNFILRGPATTVLPARSALSVVFYARNDQQLPLLNTGTLLCEACLANTGYRAVPMATLYFNAFDSRGPELGMLSTPYILPVVLRFTVPKADEVRDEVLDFLFQSCDIPQLRSPSQIPFTYFRLHDGSAEHGSLTQEHRHVTFSMCESGQWEVPSLQVSARLAICNQLELGDQDRNIVERVNLLPVPLMMQKYLLLS